MAKQNNKTTFQKLGDMFSLGGPKKVLPKTTTYQVDTSKKELLRTQSKAEFEQAKLEKQQQLYLSNTWEKVDNELYQKSIFYETTRVASYTDYEAMEFTPEISAALDIMMEESTTLSEQGKMINIYSESDRIKKILNELFFDIMDIHTNLPAWTRNVCKYGDNFLHLRVDSNEGVIGVTQLPNVEIERKEGEDSYSSSRNSYSTMNVEDIKKKNVSFNWKEKDHQFNSWGSCSL